MNPRYRGVNDQAIDWAYVVLKEPITDVPLIPMAAGCERSMLAKQGAQVYFSGFSPNESKVKSMTKLRWAKTSVRRLRRGSIEAGGRRVTACGGDSGGPLLARVPDGSWRTIGIASTLANGCGKANGYNTYALVGKDMTAWIERETGVDVTPCADEEGKPTPSLECDKLMAYSESPDNPTGTRKNTCSEAKTLPAKDACEVPDSGESEGSTGGEGESSTAESDGSSSTTDQESSSTGSEDESSSADETGSESEEGESTAESEKPSDKTGESKEPTEKSKTDKKSPEESDESEESKSNDPSVVSGGDPGGCSMQAQALPASLLFGLFGLGILRRRRR